MLASSCAMFMAMMDMEKGNGSMAEERWRYGVLDKLGNRNMIDRALNLYRNDFDHAGYGPFNLIDILKRSRTDLSGADFSTLDLRNVSFNGIQIGIKMLGARLDHSAVSHSTFLSFEEIIDDLSDIILYPDFSHVIFYSTGTLFSIKSLLC